MCVGKSEKTSKSPKIGLNWEGGQGGSSAPTEKVQPRRAPGKARREKERGRGNGSHHPNVKWGTGPKIPKN